jgi:thiamine pyrophosphate-dependent acetolactate synthase large subunit-like protein
LPINAADPKIAAMTSLTVSGRVAQVLSSYLSDVFGVMGNGNVYFLDAAEKQGLRFTPVRHEGAAIAAADAYYRTSGRLAAGTTTYGPGYTNALTALAEAVQAQIPVVLGTGDAPSTGARPWDVDQTAIAAGLGAATFTVTRSSAGAVTQQAVEYAITKRTAVVLAIPYDLAALEAAEEDLPAPLAAAVTDDVDGGLGRIAAHLARAKRPLILAGRGAHLAGAGPELRGLADRLGALTAGTALALNLLEGEGYLGVAGGFGTDTAAGLMAEADVVLVAGASLSPFTLRFGHLIGPDATMIQIDAALEPTNPRVDMFLSADVKAAAGRILDSLDGVPASAAPTAWRTEARKRLASGAAHHPGSAETVDGRLDPRALATALDAILPERRTVVQDGGHFIGWAPMYWRIPRPQDLVMVGTAYQSIGLGLASAVGAARAVEDGRTLVLAAGDGGFLMGLSDLESLVGAAKSAVVVIYNDAAYGAEIHQYGSQGLTEKPMLIPEVDFSGVARALGAESAVIRSLSDLAALQDWIDDGARGTFVADCRITSSVRAPWLSEWMQASQAASAAQAAKEKVAG